MADFPQKLGQIEGKPQKSVDELVTNLECGFHTKLSNSQEFSHLGKLFGLTLLVIYILILATFFSSPWPCYQITWRAPKHVFSVSEQL